MIFHSARIGNFLDMKGQQSKVNETASVPVIQEEYFRAMKRFAACGYYLNDDDISHDSSGGLQASSFVWDFTKPLLPRGQSCGRQVTESTVCDGLNS